MKFSVFEGRGALRPLANVLENWSIHHMLLDHQSYSVDHATALSDSQ